MNKDYKIILDTDIGDDVDDLFALLFTETAKLNVIGYTTVFRNSLQRAKMIKYILRKLSLRNIPVYAGIDKPLVQRIQDLRTPEMYEKEEKLGYYRLPQYLDDMDGEVVDKGNAVDFIIESAKKYGKELVIMAIGPLTNVALAIAKEPEIMRGVKEIRIIAGAYGADFAEWNVLCDPEAARMVFTSGIEIKVFGLNVTSKCPLTDDMLNVLKSLKNKDVKFIKTMIDMWFEHYKFDRPVMHDPLLVASFLDDEAVTYYEKNLLIELSKEKRGWTILEESPTIYNSKVKVGLDVKPERFYKLFNETVFKLLRENC